IPCLQVARQATTLPREGSSVASQCDPPGDQRGGRPDPRPEKGERSRKTTAPPLTPQRGQGGERTGRIFTSDTGEDRPASPTPGARCVFVSSVPPSFPLIEDRSQRPHRPGRARP